MESRLVELEDFLFILMISLFVVDALGTVVHTYVGRFLAQKGQCPEMEVLDIWVVGRRGARGHLPVEMLPVGETTYLQLEGR